MRKRSKSKPTIRAVPDDLWKRIESVLPRMELEPSGGRPWADPRQILDGVLYVLRTGCQWKALPSQFGSGSTCHRRFQRWAETGVWEKMLRVLLREYDDLHGLDWRWQSADTSLHKAPLGGEKNRAKSNGSGQERYQAPRAHRGRRSSDRARRKRRHHA